MDKGGESSSPAEIPYAPATPAKSGRSDPDVICENKKSFSYWEGNLGNLGSTSQLFEMNGGLTYNGFCMDNVETWHSISCRDLLALADATIVATGLNAPQYDLNKPPQTITESHLSTGLSLSSHFTPLTPDHAKRAEFRHMASDIAISNEEHPLADISTLGEANQEKGLTEETNVNVNETPQPKQRRRKHRPKVVIEGQPKRSRKSTTPKKPDGSSITPNPNVSSTGKRKYVRKKVVEKPTPTPVMEETSGTIDPSPDQQNKNSCKRKIHFDEPEKVTEVVVEKIQVELTLDKSKTCKSPNPITPSKTELPHEKRTYTKAKCRINFLQETHDKAPSGIPSPNESNCSTSINISTGVSTDIGTGTSTIISNDTGGCFKGEEATGSKKIRVCCESLEAYLSAYTDYNSGMHIPDIFKKNKIGKCESAERSACKALEMSTLHGVKENPIKKRTKALTEVCDSASYQRHMYMEAHAADFQVSVATKKRVKKNATMPALYHNHHMGCHPNLRLKNIYYDIHGLIKDFERLNMENQMTEQHMGALIPYLSGYNDNNALVVYQQDGTLVPFEGLFNPVKKRKPRPKVDLDDETSRVWRLLLEDINSQGIDGTDEDKAKWWEEERRVFCGRADSFIARMHLVQGDRRFSRWKGSVLDSVIGVFLTQNVSDHLSSSAFMSLAARYPVKSKSTSEPLQEEQPILYVKEPCQEDQNETIKWHEENSNHPMEDHGSMMLQDAESSKEKVANSSEFYINSTSSECVVLEKSKKDLEVDDIVSSPSSVQSSVAHTVEEQKDGSKATVLDGYTSFVELLHMQKGPTTVRGSYSQEQADESSNKKITHDEEKCASEESGLSAESAVQMVKNLKVNTGQHTDDGNCEATESNNIVETLRETVHKVVEFNVNDCGSNQVVNGMDEGSSKVKRVKTVKVKKIEVEWDNLRLQAEVKEKKERSPDTMDSLDYDAVMKADVNDIADAIKERGMNNVLAGRIKDLLDRLVKDHGSIDLEWLRDVPPDKAKEYLLSFRGLGLKSVECVRLLTLHHLAFPVDTNVGRIAVRLGWVPLQPLPESLQLHLLELYPVLESIQKYLWPRLCKLDQRTLYELHYQMITFGKVFCTKSKPNCNACPMRGECRHFASAFASARLGLPAPDEKSTVTAIENTTGQSQTPIPIANQQHLTLPPANEQLPHGPQQLEVQICNPVIEEPASPEPIVEVPETPEPEQIQQEFDIEDFCEDPEEIPMIKLNIEEFTQNLQTYMERHMELGEGDMSRALVALTSEAAAIPTPKLKNVSQLRTEHQVYELPDSHPLLEGLDTREPDDPCSYLLAIWTPGETADSIQPPVGQCSSQESGTLCNEETCFFCNSTREANSQTVRGTLLIPCRTAMRGSFPLNGTYFQVNEVFADHESSLNPIDVPRSWLWNLPRRIVYFGTSIPTIFKGLTTEDIQYCFWRGFVCVRGFDQKTRAPRPLMARLHFPASRLKRSRGKTDEIKH